MTFSGKTAWLTGASSGIGRALAQCLAKHGANVIISGRNLEELIQTKVLCGAAENRVFELPFDLAGQPDFARLAKTAVERFGGVDLFINSAGISQRSLAVETDLAVDRRFMEVNFFGPVGLVKALLPGMIVRRSGQIVLVSSLAGLFGTPMRSSYAASKHALHGYFDSLRAEVAHHGIYVTLACPGYVATTISMNSLTGDGSKYGKVDETIAHGMPVMRCAEKILEGAYRKKEEVLIGGREKYAVYVKRFFPRLFSRLVRNVKV